MSDIRQAAQQALEAIEHLTYNARKSGAEMGLAFVAADESSAALRAALAEPDVPETRFGDMPERLRTYSADTELSDRYSDAMQEAADEIERLGAALAAAVAEPVAVRVPPATATEAMVLAGMRRMFDDKRYSAPWEVVIERMYEAMIAAAPAAPPQREPLTDEQIDDLSREMVKGGKSVNWLCRAIERAHGISAPKEQA